MSQQSTICRLCINNCDVFKSLYHDHGGTNDIYNMVLEYFHPKIVDMEVAKHLVHICLQCFELINTFHTFQGFVKTAQLKLIDQCETMFIKTEKIDAPLDQEVVIKMEHNDVSRGEEVSIKTENIDAAMAEENTSKTEEDEHLLGMPQHQDDISNAPVEEYHQSGVWWEIKQVDDNVANVPRTATTTSRSATDIIIKQELEIMDVQSPDTSKPRVKCQVCGRTYSGNKSLSTHLRKAHPGVRPSHFDATYNATTKQFTCQICGNRFPFKNQLSFHMRSLHGNQNNPPPADGNAASECGTSEGNEPSKTFKCHICNNVFRADITFRRHLHRQHPGIIPSMFDSEYDVVTKCFKCCYCKKSFPIKGSLVRHRRKWHKKEIKAAQRAAKKEAEKQAAKQAFLKRQAAKLISQAEGNITSQAVDDANDNDQPNKSECKICGNIYANVTGLRRHLKKTHPGVTLHQFDSSYDPVTKRFQCEVCSNTFPEKRNLTLHFMWMHGRKRLEMDEADFKHKCALCSNYFANARRLSHHMRQRHPGVKASIFCSDYDVDSNTFKCRCCGDTFMRRGNLAVHMEKRHQKQIDDDDTASSESEPEINMATSNSQQESEFEDPEGIVTTSPALDNSVVIEAPGHTKDQDTINLSLRQHQDLIKSEEDNRDADVETKMSALISKQGICKDSSAE